jgi:hypothetical protein
MMPPCPQAAKPILIAILWLAATSGCPSPPQDDCADRAEELGFAPCTARIDDQATWEQFSIPAGQIDLVRATKHLVPAHEDARLHTLYVDANRYLLHYDFIVEVFGDRFVGLTPVDYIGLVLDPAQREFYSGTVGQYLRTDGTTVYGFTVWDDLSDPAGGLTQAEVEAAYAQIEPTFGLRPLAWVPVSNRQRTHARTWNLPFATHDPANDIAYEAYTVGTGYGTLRLLPVDELRAAIQEASFGFRDLLVLDDAPLDIERVIAGAVTAARQNELSHLNIRSAARGTPNCYLRDAFEALAQWEGQLVALTCGADSLSVEAATLEDAEAFWAELRPDPVDVPTADLTFDQLTGLLAMPTATPEERADGVRRFGSKAAALGTLYQRIDPELQLQGFGIPFAWYDAFMRSHRWDVDGDELTFAETLERWLADDAFLSDAPLRRSRLEALRGAMRAAPQDTALLEALGARITEVWGTDTHMVRFRSSSNAEDGLQFSGAGLYDSTSVCLADGLDGDDLGPSRCDPDRSNERTLSRALGMVWASLWHMAAFEERAWYGIDHADVAMGILVNDRSVDERANLVVFTGDPAIPGAQRFVVNAQAGDASVVSPRPGEVVEKSLLTLVDGEVTVIDRVRASNLVPAGHVVLDDARLREVGAAMAAIEADYPVDEAPPPGGVVLLDSEWKVLSDGRLIVKQVRPFLRMEN